jgi:hypothetical protein
MTSPYDPGYRAGPPETIGEADPQLKKLIEGIRQKAAALGMDPGRFSDMLEFPADEAPHNMPIFGRKKGGPSDAEALDQRYYSIWALNRDLNEKMREEGLPIPRGSTDKESLDWYQSKDEELLLNDAWGSDYVPYRPSRKKEQPAPEDPVKVEWDRRRYDSYLTENDERELFGRSREKIMEGRDPHGVQERKRRRYLRISDGAAGAAAGLSMWSGEMGRKGERMAERVRRNRIDQMAEFERPEKLRRYDIDTDLGYAAHNRELGRKLHDLEDPTIKVDGTQLDPRSAAMHPDLNIEAMVQDLGGASEKLGTQTAMDLARARANAESFAEAERMMKVREHQARMAQIAQSLAEDKGQRALAAGADPKTAEAVAQATQQAVAEKAEKQSVWDNPVFRAGMTTNPLGAPILAIRDWFAK